MIRLSFFVWDIKAVACSIACFLFFSSAAAAGCTALPIVSKLIVEIERLKHLSDQQAVVASAWKIKNLGRSITRPSMFLRLSELGFQRKLPDVMGLKHELATLTSIAKNGIPSDVQEFLGNPRFLRNYDSTKQLTSELCVVKKHAKQSDAAQKEFGALSALGIGKLTGIGTPAVTLGLLALAITSLIGLSYGTRLRRNRLKRDRRRNKRYPCDVAVYVTKPNHMSEHRLVDISRSGANMENPLELLPGAILKLDFGGLARMARVTWSNTQFAGVEFDKSLSENEMQSVIQHACALIASSNEKRDAATGIAHIS